MTESDLLRCLIQVVGRVAVPRQEVREIVGPKKKSRIRAFNLCDGSNSLTEIARKAKVNQGNLSRSVAIWLANGIAFWVGEGRDARLLHIHPIPEKERRRAEGNRAR